MNQNYDQLTQLLADEENLDWEADFIQGWLVTGGSFTATDSRFSQTGGVVSRRARLNGRASGDGELWGQAMLFENVRADVDHQLLIVKDDGGIDPVLLSFFDTDFFDNPLRVSGSGSLIVRPYAEAGPESQPYQGVWITYEA